MNERAAALRRQIALCRSYLADGTDARHARLYLGEIARMELEKAEIEKTAARNERLGNQKPEGPAGSNQIHLTVVR